MKLLTRTATLGAVLLCIQAGNVAIARPVDDLSGGTGTTFILPAVERSDAGSQANVGGLVERLCAEASQQRSTICPPALNHEPAANDLAIAADLPHLRLNIVLRVMRHVVVKGIGVQSTGLLDGLWARFHIGSAAATDSLPGSASDGYALPVPSAGETWGDIPHANALFQGDIENGCVGTPATFDLQLESSVYRIGSGEMLGEIGAADEVDGSGPNNFSYTIRASDAEGNVSDFVFEGDANAYCTSKTTLENDPSKALAPSVIENLRRSDFLTAEDVSKSPDGYRLAVPDVGTVYVKAIRSATGERCLVHRPSLVKAIAAHPPTGTQPKWLQLTIYDSPLDPGHWICLGPLGGGCYILISAHQPS